MAAQLYFRPQRSIQHIKLIHPANLIIYLGKSYTKLIIPGSKYENVTSLWSVIYLSGCISQLLIKETVDKLFQQAIPNWKLEAIDVLLEMNSPKLY